MTATTPDVPDVPPLPEETERRFPTVAIWAGVAALVVGLVAASFSGGAPRELGSEQPGRCNPAGRERIASPR